MESYCTCSVLGKKHPTYSKVETTEMGERYKTTNCSEPYGELQTSGWSRMKIPMIAQQQRAALLPGASRHKLSAPQDFMEGPHLLRRYPWPSAAPRATDCLYTPWMSTDENKVPFYPTSLCFCR